ncbi:glycine N-acyltransferase-like protein 3 [Ostrinia furnacalis]|uniref:glycine N-acyltransferase-like protein 3 n=1 Tax=Ostrinia furnacalis TaxID=93504 RepID=UPI00103E2D44|nr:glycine N-acyltransferase-like protein 3 [Ostrinia furnacalis]
MDSLLEVPNSELPKLRDLFRTHWPHGVEGFCLLNANILYPALTEFFSFKFYCPGGKIANGLVAISDKEYYQVYICPVTEDVSIMENALYKTSVIDWNRVVTVPSASANVVAALKRLCSRLDLKIIYENRCCKHLLDRDNKPFDLSDPVNTYVGPMKREHLKLVNETWTFYSDRSYSLFETLMNNGLTYMLYSSEDHSPLSWITVDEAGAFTHLYCLDAYRRKGYAEYITKVTVNDLLQQGKDVLAYTLEDNVKPQKLFEKLGFDFLGYVWWIRLTKDKGN